MTNLYDFLRGILDQFDGVEPFKIELSQEDGVWLKQFLQAPDNQIHFKSRLIGHEDGEPVYEKDFAIAGKHADIFFMLSEAMLQNGTFAEIVINAGRFFEEHVPTCRVCSEAVKQSRQEPSWEFKQHPQ